MLFLHKFPLKRRGMCFYCNKLLFPRGGIHFLRYEIQFPFGGMCFLCLELPFPSGGMRYSCLEIQFPFGGMCFSCNKLLFPRGGIRFLRYKIQFPFGGVEITACEYHSPGFLPALKIFVLYFRGYVVLFRKPLYCWSVGNFGEQPFWDYSSKFFSQVQVTDCD